MYCITMSLILQTYQYTVYCISVCADQRAVLHVLSQQPVVIQRVLGFPCHSVHGSLVHLVLYCSEQHVERLPC